MSPLLDIRDGRPQTVATYYIATDIVGHGRFSEVYKAFDSSTQTHVALKIYIEASEKSHELARMEQATLQELNHLNVSWFPKIRGAKKCRINNKNYPLIVLELGEYVEADGISHVTSLKSVMPSHGDINAIEPIPNREFWSIKNIEEWIIAMANAVKAMHSLKIIHHDIKPENILIKKDASMSRAVPFFLDFNSTAKSGEYKMHSGTPKYLPPEVTTGARKNPTEEDDLYAIALICWEMFFGVECPLDGNHPIHPWLSAKPSDALVNVLKKALEIRPINRYQTADDLLKAINETINGAMPSSTINAEEFADCLKEMKKVRTSINEELAGEGELPIPKEVYDLVSILFSWLAEENSQSLDLASDLMGIGSKALPAALQQGYKLLPYSNSFKQVLEVLKTLGEKEPDLAQKSIEHYALSSNRNVRSMCRTLCASLQIFPNILLEQLIADEGILLPSERVDLADLCIRYSKDDSALLALTKYMCREYIQNPDTKSYLNLREHVAWPMSTLSFQDKALLIVQDTSNHIWEELDEFNEVEKEKRQQIERGLLQLMADAFAGMGDEALNLFEQNKVPRFSNGENKLAVYRVFLQKLAEKNSKAFQWLEKKYRTSPENRDFTLSFEKIKNRQKDPSENTVQENFDFYMKGGASEAAIKTAYDSLRFIRTSNIFDLIDKRIKNHCSDEGIDRIIHLLEGFESRQRYYVSYCVVNNWDALSSVNMSKCIDILSSHGIPSTQLKDEALHILGSELEKQDSKKIREGIDRLLM